MTQVAEEKRRGNPEFGKKKTEPKWNPQKRYQFKLAKSYDSAKPRDKDTGQLADNPYPPIYMITNEGVGVHPTRKEIENWRYVYGYNSIWVKDQEKPEPSKRQLENPKNFIEFLNGSLFVQGNNTALLEALTIQDIFEGVVNPVNQVPPTFLLVDEEKTRRIVRQTADIAYEAEKAAREATLSEMIPVAMAFGIDVDDPEENEDKIRTEFIVKAKQMPDQFSKQFVNPKNKFKYNIVEAMRDNLISTDVIAGKMVLVGTGKAYFDVKEGTDAAETFATLLMQDNSEALKLYQQLDKMFVGAEV